MLAPSKVAGPRPRVHPKRSREVYSERSRGALPTSPASILSDQKSASLVLIHPLFSYSYELLFLQAFSFDNHPHCPGVSPMELTTKAFSPSLRPLCLCGKLRIFIFLQTLFSSCRSFSAPSPLFSIVCTLFCKNTPVFLFRDGNAFRTVRFSHSA